MASRARTYAKDVLTGPYSEIQDQLNSGTALSSVASRFFSEMQEGNNRSEMEKEVMRNVLANAYLAGSDTSTCALYNVVLALAIHPEVQKRAQKELDDVLGGTSLPDFNDYSRLPYVTALVNEVFRCYPVTPFAVYHVSTQDDVYNGYEIPKGSILIPNAYALLHDESLFGPNTDKFNPDRFIKPDGTVNPDLSNIEVAFGFGRRACPGRFIAKDTIWVMAASILTAFEITDPLDMNGNKLTSESTLEFTNAMISFPPRMKVTFKPRIPESIIHDAVKHQ
ncbi:cytochrome P450 [Dendrothele bispora CBS 962.96]|uniref:Cytochrome P450 n=1 Tax=Dendrothele bispora (strain CBS 962.96) TaxID=1314807 RepID=A0A4S8L1L1_DENBC|nr:cytochrome P450 [Dendrothele bispora CBS 962.96]